MRYAYKIIKLFKKVNILGFSDTIGEMSPCTQSSLVSMYLAVLIIIRQAFFKTLH